MTSRPAKIFALLIAISALAGAYSVHLGVSQMWDIKNYHLYNPYAFLGERYLTDVAPAQLQTFFNPTLDLPFYLMIKYWNDWPRLIAFLIGALHGLTLSCIALLAWHLLGEIDGMSKGLRVFLAAAALLIGSTGADSVPLIGAWTGDAQSALPVLAALLFAIYGIDRARTNPAGALRLIAVAGLLAGFAVGLKLTVVIYGVALAVSILVLPRPLLFGAAFRYAAAGVVGALASGGLYHFTMWRLFGNPVFPMYNNIFRSPYAKPVLFTDPKFVPKTWSDWVTYPYEWAYGAHPGLVSQLAFRDIRIATAISLGALTALAWLTSRLMQQQRAPVTPGVQAVIIFMVFSYALWLAMFAMYRYLLPLELLSGVAIVLALGYLARRDAWPVLAALAAVLCLVTTIPQEWGRARISERYLEITAPRLKPNTLVVIVGGEPVAYFIPFIDQNVTWVSVMSNFLRPGQDNLFMRRARDLIRNHDGPLLTLQAGAKDDAFAKVLSSFSLVPASGNCEPLYSNLGRERYRLCPVQVQATN